MNTQGKNHPHLKTYLPFLLFLLAAALLGGLFLVLRSARPARAEKIISASSAIVNNSTTYLTSTVTAGTEP